MIKIFHTADLHLDSPNSGLGLAAAEAIRSEQRNVFSEMMHYANENEFDLILICGDLFDGKYISNETKNLVKKCFAELSCPVVIAPGNHDPYNQVSLYSSGELGDNVYIFSSESMQIFDFDEIGVSVCGYAFMSDRLEHSPIADFTPRKHHLPLVLCAHADLGAVISKYAPVTVSQIKEQGFSYAALGHIHNAPSELDDIDNIKYCGFPVGRSFDELGDGGALAVTLDTDLGTVKTERIIFSEHRFVKDILDVSSAGSDEDIETLIKDFVSKNGYGKETSLYIELCGALDMSYTPSLKRLSSIPLPLRWLKLKDTTTAIPDTERLENDLTLRGEFYRTLLPLLNSDDPNDRKAASSALRIGLCAIDGQNVADLLGIKDQK